MAERDEVSPAAPLLTRRDLLEHTALAALGLMVGACGSEEGRASNPGEMPPVTAADGGPAPEPGAAPGGEDAEAKADAEPGDAGAEDADGGAEPEETVVDEADPEQLSESMSFPQGVASGDVTQSGVLLWTQYLGALPLRVVVWAKGAPGPSPRGASAWRGAARSQPVSPADGGFVHVDISGLRPGREYRYAFYEGSGGEMSRSEIGRFRTQPRADALERVVFGATCCTFNGNDLSALERAGERDDLDAFIHLGDTTYNDYVYTTEHYRIRWAESLTTLAYRSLRASTSGLSTWDDHEVFNNWDPETIDPAHLDVATHAFFEHQPIRRSSSAPNRIWRKASWGRTVDVFVLDCRSERRPSTRFSPDAQYLSREQMDWLKEGLLASEARFKLIVNSVPITSYRFLLNYEAHDRWEGYPAARGEILGHIEENAIEGVIWLAGDFHLGSLGRVSASGVGSGALEVLAGPGGQVGNNLANFLIGAQFDWATKYNNYTTLEFDPQAGQLTVTYWDAFGEIMTRWVYDL